MKLKRLWPLLWTFSAGLLALTALLAGLRLARAQPAAIGRADPVVISGAGLDLFLGAPLDDLALYAFDGAAWQPVPFQVDEVAITGSVYISYEDGLLDANDELVFMGNDAAAVAPADHWPDDAQARLNPRYAITVTDPLNPGDPGWLYLYRSATLVPSGAGYVEWDEPAQRLSAISYTAAFSPAAHLGLASLWLNDQPFDVLDRQKLRVATELYLGPVPISSATYTEEDVGPLLGVPLTVTLPAVGPVRAAGGDLFQRIAFYGARLDLSVSVPLTDVITSGLRLHFQSVRVSTDLNDPAATGMSPATYFSSLLSGGVAVNGLPDTVPASAPAWYQVAGAAGGLVTVLDVDPGNGLLSNYYLDDAALDPADTGDGRSYGDAGLRIAAASGSSSIGLVTLNQTTYFLPGDSANVGAAHLARANNPLLAFTAAQLFPAAPLRHLYLPMIQR